MMTGKRSAGAGMPAEFTLQARRTPVYRSVDVLVCGGGLAGVSAAAAAALAGAETLLVERNVVLGGNGPLSFRVGVEPTGAGISAEITRLLRENDGWGEDETAQGAPVYDPEALKYACLDLVRDAGVHLLLSSWVSDPLLHDGAVRGAMVENKSGRFAILAKTVIDATGDADLALRAGAAIQPPIQVPVATNARIGGIDFDRALAGQSEWSRLVKAAKQAGVLDAAQPDTIALFGVTARGRQRGMAFLSGVEFPCKTAWDANELGEAEIAGRKLIRQFIGFLKTVPGFEQCFLVDVAGAISVAQSRHVVGEYLLQYDDIVSGKTHEDDVFRCTARGDKASGFGIPFRCLVPRGVDGLIVAGRAVSIAPDAYKTFGERIDGAALGEAAGRAATQAALGAATAKAIEKAPTGEMLPLG